jgi:hypothetical protein
MSLFWLLAVLGSATDASAARRQSAYHLRSARAAGSTDRVDLALEVSGEVQVTQADLKDEIKMRVLANLSYEERTLETTQSGVLRSARFYDKAAAKVQAGENSLKPALRESRRLLGVCADGSAVTLFSPDGPLTRDELDLVDLLGNSLLLDRLLPNQRVRIGQKWKHSTELMAALLGFDKVTSAEVTSTFSEVKQGTGRFDMQGTVRGEDKGAAATAELRAKYHFDLSSRRITWFGLVVQEKRNEGLVEEAFEAIARLQMKITPNSRPKHLTSRSLQGVALRLADELVQLEYQSPQGGWSFINDRKWFVTTDEQSRVVLDLIDGQRRIAQCHVSSAGASDKTTMEEFQRDVEKGLGDHFGRFVQAAQNVNELGYREYRLTVEGVVEDVPIQWIYYLVADKQGHQAVMAFIVEADNIERFAEADRPLAATLRFADSKLAARPVDTGAEPASQ